MRILLLQLCLDLRMKMSLRKNMFIRYTLMSLFKTVFPSNLECVLCLNDIASWKCVFTVKLFSKHEPNFNHVLKSKTLNLTGIKHSMKLME